MAGRMPVLGQCYMMKACGQAIDDRDDGIAIGDRECATGAKIVLNVDDQQQIVIFGPDRHSIPALELVEHAYPKIQACAVRIGLAIQGRPDPGSVTRISCSAHARRPGRDRFLDRLSWVSAPALEPLRCAPEAGADV